LALILVKSPPAQIEDKTLADPSGLLGDWFDHYQGRQGRGLLGS
jgi:hypothetical protein